MSWEVSLGEGAGEGDFQTGKQGESYAEQQTTTGAI
jgi:hypothetical protein